MASKSTSLLGEYWPHKRGLDAEALVAQFLQNRAYIILFNRLKTPYGEIDLLVRSPKGGIAIVEVKSLGRWDWLQSRITHYQIKRLKNCRLYLESTMEQRISLCAAFVVGSRIQFIPLD